MAASPALEAERSRLGDELLAVHTIMRRGTALVSEAFARLAGGYSVDVKVLVNATRWLIAFIHGHHESAEQTLWPVLRDRFPERAVDLDLLTTEHQALEVELHALARVVDAIDIPQVPGEREAVLGIVGAVALTGLPAVETVQTSMERHADAEEPVLLDLFPKVADEDVAQLRSAVFDGAPHAGPSLVFGLMGDPEPVAGYERIIDGFPVTVRWLRPVLRARYKAVKKALCASEQPYSR
ncbi:hemerythrin domain-containing protein [Streptomyces sp. NRRL F-5135]|uniref:hemerythrin domain-containing protein n=1 Tax=Streptomyces sp. NRRL F-5135 TaxID=1463858 RepID=UPI0004C9B6DE|nr:hemerythrin domain-containing protein [Streptomyces sp. NRRL F-5135]